MILCIKVGYIPLRMAGSPPVIVQQREPLRHLPEDRFRSGFCHSVRRLLNGTHGTKTTAGPSPATVKARLTPSALRA